MTLTLSWTDANGTTTPLDGSTGIRLRGVPSGFWAPAPTNTVDEYVGFDGGALTSRRRPTRSITLGLTLSHATRVASTITTAASIFQGPGVLTWTDEIETRRLTQVVYDGGLDTVGDGNLLQRLAVVSLLALDPWWYGSEASSSLPVGSATTFDAVVAFSAAVSFDGGISAGVVISGDTATYPVISVTGPADVLTIRNGSLSWSIAAALASGSTLVVDHRPGSRGPKLNGGNTNWSLLTEASRLWPLEPGTASIVVEVTSFTGDTTISMTWEPRYLTP